LTWDVGHDAKADYREQPILMHYQDRIKHMHLHDCMGNSDHKTLYTGDVPINERIRFAYQKDLSVVIEVKTSEALKESVLKLRAHLHALQEQKGE
jgi:sugar phosphate isomerase/epimerase